MSILRADAAARTSLLITGFGPFPRMPDNATSRLVPALAQAARSVFPDLAVRAEILATEWVAAPRRLDALVSEAAPDLALHFGVSSKARGFEIETAGRNVRGRITDAGGKLPAGSAVARAGPDLIASTLPVGRIVERLRARGLPAFVSRDAGTYLCNALLYHSLARGRADAAGVRRGFVHIPAQLAYLRAGTGGRRGRSPLDWTDALSGGLEIIAASLGRPTPASAARIAAAHDWS